VHFSIGLPTDRVEHASEFVTGPAISEMAALAEATGWDACFVTDHPAPDARWLAAGGHHALDPLVALSFAAAATTTLHVQTHIMVLAYRNPFLAAKSVLSLEILSEGRLILGVAAGYLRPEFAALGVDFDERNALTDEAIDVLRVVFRDDAVAYEGRHFRSRGTTMLPRPVPGRPPIWVGGNSTGAIRRAVERGDGWVPFPNPASAARAVRTAEIATLDDLAHRIDRLRSLEAEAGRDAPLDVCFAPFSLDPLVNGGRHDAERVVDELHQLAALGVTWCATSAPPAGSRVEYLRAVEQLARDVVTRFRHESRSRPPAGTE
jgi:probable F420-dependent oxidoreductase